MSDGADLPLIKKLDSVIESLPKEGYKAAVAIGVVDSIRNLVSKVVELSSKIECVAKAKGSCKEEYCDPNCARLFLEKFPEGLIVGKYKSNAFSAKLYPDRLDIATKGVRLVVDGNTARIGRIGPEGYVWETVNLSDVQDLYLKNYSIKYAARRVGKPVRASLDAIQKCALQNAIVC